MRVLVVDDDAAVREGLLDALETEGHAACGVADGQAALALLCDGFAPDVIVLDLMMPVMSGAELRARLRRDPEWTRIPLVVLSAASEATRAQAQGEASLQKPFDLAEFLRLLDRLVARGTDGAA